MSFLAKLGKILATITPLALGIGPIVSSSLGSKGDTVAAITNDLTLIGGVIVQIETALQGQAGADKFKAATALVGPIIRTSQLVSGKKIADPALLQKGIGEVTQGVVDILNSIHQDSVSTEVKV